MALSEADRTDDRLAAKDWWDVSLKAVGVLGTIAGVVIGVWQYNSQNAEEKRMEFKRSMYAKKLAAYEMVGSAVGNILNIHREDANWIDDADTLAFDSCVRSFRTLYWGVLPLVEDSIVESSMIQFRTMARYYRRRENTYQELARSGMSLMNACKRSLEAHWNKKPKDE